MTKDPISNSLPIPEALRAAADLHAAQFRKGTTIPYRQALAGSVLCVLAVLHVQAQQRSIDAFFEDFTAEWVRLSPNQATASRYFTGAEQDVLETQLTPLTRAWRHRRVELARRGLAELKTFDRARLTGSQRLSADLMAWQLQVTVDGEKFEDFTFPLEQFRGVNVELVNQLTVLHPINTEKDAVNYVARLGQVAARMNEAVAEAMSLAQKKMLPPRFIVNATVTQMQQFISTPAAENPYVTVFANRMAAASGIRAAKRDELRAAAERLVASQVYPAWRNALTVLQPLADRTTDDAGLWRFKGGEDAYAYHLRQFTTTNLSADEIHQIGLREVARIDKEMDTILRRLGRANGTVQQRIDQLKKDLAYPLTESGRTQIMTDINDIITDAQRRTATLFDRTPKAEVIARPVPRFRESTSNGGYTAPTRDGSRPGTFQIPLRPSNMTKFGLKSLVYHETVPGHHYHVGLQIENDTIPRFRQNAVFGNVSAFAEGWGLYAERLAAENGWYEGDPEGQLGQLDAALFRARRLVVDTGLHAKHWTRQQAIDYGIEASEVDRYVVVPGQACAYMLGQLTLVELRDKAQKALGSRYSAKAFHNAVLMAGTMPLSMLEREVDAFIRNQK